MFPQSKFIHITRNPFELFSSTKRLWTALDEVQAFQRPHERDLEEYVFNAFERMYGGFERQRVALPATRICDVRYEDLIQDPVGTLRGVYEQLDLGDFESVRGKIEESMQQRRGHRTNRHEIAEHLRRQIEARWASYFRNYGYATNAAATAIPVAAAPPGQEK
jgi:hypothetical protein